MNWHLLILLALLCGSFILAYGLRRWKWISGLALAGAVMLLILLIAEFTYRWFFRPAGPVKQQECGTNCFLPDSLLGYKPGLPGRSRITITAGGDTIVNAHYTLIADTTPRGMTYNHRTGYSNPQSRREAVFMGCSFTFGENIDDSASLPYLFGKIANISSRNLGCPGYGLNHVFQICRMKYGGMHNEGRVFVYSLLSDHFYRAEGVYDWTTNGPYFKEVNDSLVFNGQIEQNISMRYRRAPFYLGFFGSLHLVEDKLSDYMLRQRMKAFDKQKYDRIFLMLKDMSAAIIKTGGKLVILNWDRNNWGYQGYDFPFQQQLDKDIHALQQPGVTIIPVSSILDYKDPSNFIPSDGHPTLLANQRIATRLANMQICRYADF
jgi:hypothetical protein